MFGGGKRGAPGLSKARSVHAQAVVRGEGAPLRVRGGRAGAHFVSDFDGSALLHEARGGGRLVVERRQVQRSLSLRDGGGWVS
jgi:hypothetical protein